MSAFFDWLISDAGAGWIIGILGILGAIYTWVQRDKPAKIVIQEINALRLLDIHVSHQERINVFYNDAQGSKEQIQSLEQKKIVIYNNGTKDISEPLQFVLKFSSSKTGNLFSGFWRLVVDNARCTSTPIKDESGNTTAIAIEVPYLISYQLHKHLITIYFISDGPVTLQLADGEGKGWSASMVPFHQIRKLRNFSKTIIITLMSISALAVILIINRIFDVVRTSIDKPDYQILSQSNLAVMTTSMIGLMVIVIILDRLSRNIGELVSSRYLGIQPSSKFDSKQ